MRGSSSLETERLRVIEAARIESSLGPRWLIENLWEEEGVGILGGAPKSCKTFLAMDLAFSVATATAALGSYAVAEPGPVLVFCAEDQPAIVLDPFVRLHRIDENSALEVSGILAYLRELQRRFHVAILVVYHSRKAGSGAEQAGLSLRGSGDFHAWGQSNLYLRRRCGVLELVIEQRNAAPPEPVQLALHADGSSSAHLEVVCAASRSGELEELKAQVLAVLSKDDAPRTQDSLRTELCVRMQRIQGALRELESEGALKRTAAGWVLRDSTNAR